MYIPIVELLVRLKALFQAQGTRPLLEAPAVFERISSKTRPLIDPRPSFEIAPYQKFYGRYSTFTLSLALLIRFLTLKTRIKNCSYRDFPTWLISSHGNTLQNMYTFSRTVQRLDFSSKFFQEVLYGRSRIQLSNDHGFKMSKFNCP
jgi:hypothetical protein